MANSSVAIFWEIIMNFSVGGRRSYLIFTWPSGLTIEFLPDAYGFMEVLPPCCVDGLWARVTELGAPAGSICSSCKKYYPIMQVATRKHFQDPLILPSTACFKEWFALAGDPLLAIFYAEEFRDWLLEQKMFKFVEDFEENV